MGKRKKNREYIEQFPTIKSLSNITNLEKRFIDGELVHILDTKEYYQYNNGEFYPLEVAKNEKLTLYDANKQFYAGAPPLDEAQITRSSELINKWADRYEDGYFMLLGHDLRYYTIFHKDINFCEIDTIGNAVIECLESIGQIKDIAEDEETQAIECWITTPGPIKETAVLYLFPYDRGIVRFGGCN